MYYRGDIKCGLIVAGRAARPLGHERRARRPRPPPPGGAAAAPALRAPVLLVPSGRQPWTPDVSIAYIESLPPNTRHYQTRIEYFCPSAPGGDRIRNMTRNGEATTIISIIFANIKPAFSYNRSM